MFYANRCCRPIAVIPYLLSIVGWSAFGAAYAADPVDEYQLKAAFILNFAKFVVWPPHATQSPADRFSICILGDDPFQGALEQKSSGKTLEGREIDVRQVSDLDSACNCRILFVSASGRKRFRAMAGGLTGNGVLTIGDVPGIAAEGAVIDFKLQAGRIRFEINLEAAEQQQLRISSKLLSLAEIVKTR